MKAFWTGTQKVAAVVWHYTKQVVIAIGKTLWFLLKNFGIGLYRFGAWAGPRCLRGVKAFWHGLSFLWKQDLVRKTATLFLLTAAVAGGLAAVNAVTADTIAGHQAEAGRNAMRTVMPGAEFYETALPLSFSDASVAEFYAAYRGGLHAGFVALVVADGFAGPIHMTVGLTLRGDLAGVAITSMSETPNVGSQALDPGWLSQFAGKSAGLRLGSGAGNTVEAITGATITAEAVLSGAMTAMGAAAAWLLETGG